VRDEKGVTIFGRKTLIEKEMSTDAKTEVQHNLFTLNPFTLKKLLDSSTTVKYVWGHHSSWEFGLMAFVLADASKDDLMNRGRQP